MSNRILQKIDKCRIVFLDLEFYVPQGSRGQSGLCYNPWDESCKLIGGAFLVVNPAKDLDMKNGEVSAKIQTLMLWDFKDEKELITNIYNLLNRALSLVHDAHNKRISPLLCGIGITSSDIPILIELFKRYELLSYSQAFKFQSDFRIIDLSQLGIACFNNSNGYLYPKVKSSLLKKYIPSKKFDTGKSVWNLYESNDRSAIISRVCEEIEVTYTIYRSIISDYQKFKYLEKKELPWIQKS